MSLTPDKSPARISAMFDAIAARYDFLNHVLSAGLDRRWRARAIREARLDPGACLIDVCCGTADMALTAADAIARSRIVGVDFAERMLAIGARKIAGAGLANRIAVVRGDATNLPVRDAWADAATIGFGIRNVMQPERALRELARVVKPGGRLAILEFGQPAVPGVRGLYNWYFRSVLPRLGRLVSKHESAYSYLPASVGTFPPPPEFVAMLSSHGFRDARAVPLSFGIVYLYIAIRA
ncbi:MAG: bifunctional demethylmenaquinone methyltransferase/2-methoxy-6-polyprenyl-1,4-benzoquinol methylase UbiE [Vicinamibacterales bacterium]